MTDNAVFVRRTAAFLPNAPVGNDEMEAVLGMAGDVPSRARRLILRNNGITSRYYAIDPATRKATHSCAALAAEAVRGLFAQGLDAAAVEVLACGTSYPDQIMPGHASMVHGLLPETAPLEIFSAAGVCVAGMAAMKAAYLAVKSGEASAAVACAAETASSVLRKEAYAAEAAAAKAENFRPELAFEKDFLRWMLSDGAGAVELSSQADGALAKICWIDAVSYANELPVCMYAGGDVEDGQFRGWKDYPREEAAAKSVMSVKQDVKLLNENVVPYTVAKALQRSIAKRGLSADAVNWFLPHYSSHYFRSKVYDSLVSIGFELPEEKWFTNLPHKGNTGSASIYIMLDEFLKSGRAKAGETILCYIPESGRFSSAFMLLEVL